MGVPAAHAVFGESEEFGRVMLPMYVGSMQVIGNRVMEAARREGFAGTLDHRLKAMGWWIEPLYTLVQARALADDSVAKEREACAVLAWSTGMGYHSERMQGAAGADARDVGSKCAAAIRARGQGEGNG